MGGEERAAFRLGRMASGLPPRGRGREEGDGEEVFHVGITPAWAGKSSAKTSHTLPWEDYPRVGGEELKHLNIIHSECGLPPRGRGRGTRSSSTSRLRGITPAWAGKRWKRAGCPRRRRDYPRVGGEEGALTPGCRWDGGLPPRGRGREACGRARPRRSRITPAWAGKRLNHGVPPSAKRDYPRVGGEESSVLMCIRAETGLPPRGRGRAPREAHGCLCVRITPAWAGKR